MSVFGVNLVRIQSECGKTRTRITPNTDTFHAVSNPMIGYSNINSIGNKIVKLTAICKISLIEILCIDEKPNHLFGGGKLVSIRNGIIANRLTVYETQNTESIFVEITVKKRKWGILFAYRPPNNNNLKLFLRKIPNLQTNFYQNLTSLQVVLT